MSFCYTEANPLTQYATSIQLSSTNDPNPCQHHSVGEDHLMAQGYRVAQFLPCPVQILSMDCAFFGRQSCLYVPSLAWQNNSTILANVARHAQWKLNCFLQKQLCDDQLPNQDPFMGHPEDEREQGCPLGDGLVWLCVIEMRNWLCDGTLEQCDYLPECYVFFQEKWKHTIFRIVFFKSISSVINAPWSR